MPLYEYECRSCGHRFEALVRDASTPACRACQAPNVERLLSLFSVNSATTRQSNLESGRRHIAKDQRDKAIAEHEEIHHHH